MRKVIVAAVALTLGFFVNLLMARHCPAFGLVEKGTGLCPVDARR